MSVNQSRADSAQYKKLGRSDSSGQQWNPSGGKGGGGTAHPPSSVNPSFSTNRSFKNPSNTQRVQPRVGHGSVKLESDIRSAGHPQQNGAHSVPTQQRTAGEHVGGVSIKSTAEVPAQRNTGPVTTQSAQPAARNSEPSAPTNHAKVSGEASKSFPLQFGTISPGFVNGMQIPARTSSAPPNLDEQKHDQARQTAASPVITHPVPSVPKPQAPRKVGVPVNDSNDDNSLQTPKAKREAQVSAAPHMPQAQMSPVHSMPGISLPMGYHQPQIGVQFGGPGLFVQQQASMPIPMTQLQQHIYVQPHPIPHQGLRHQGQSLNYPQQMLGRSTGAQFTQQQPAGNYGSPRTKVKITNPETNEELRFDESLGSKPQTLPNSVTPTHTVNYYGPYHPPANIFPVPGSIPTNNIRIAPNSQQGRFGYTVNQGTHSLPYSNASNANYNQMHGIADPAAPHASVRPVGLPHAVKMESPAAIGSTSVDKVNSSHSQREPVTHSIQKTASAVANDEGRSAEVVNMSDSLKNLQNENNKGGQSPTHQVSTQSDLSSQSLHQSVSVANSVTVPLDGEKVYASNGTSESSMFYNETFTKLSGSSDSSVTELNDSVKVDTLPSGNNSIKENLTLHTEPHKHETIGEKEHEVGMKEVSKHDINDSVLSLDSVSPRSSEVANQSKSYTDKKMEEIEREKSSDKFVDSTHSVDSSLNSEGDGSSTASSPKEERPVSELSRTKSTVSRGKKKRKEILQKADAVGASDLYNAYKAPTTPSEGSENSPSDQKQQVEPNEPQNDIIPNEKVAQGKSEPDDWEDAADISTPKLAVEEKHFHGSSAKKYSRDFLLTLSEHHTDLPEDFDLEIGGEILMGSNANSFRDSYPSPGRGSHRTVSAPGRDNYGNALSRDSRQGGGNYGVLRNPRSPAGPYGGGILTGPMMHQTANLQRNNSESDRWQRSSSQKGLIPSPHAPMQVMHKAEKKYEVGNVTDEEQAKQRQLKSILNKLTPQNFDKLFQQVKNVNIDNANTLSGVISQIFDKALTEPTFCEMYANFCFHLSRELPDFRVDNEKITFKRLLISKCQMEFERGEREQEEANKAEEEGEVKLSMEEREEKRLKARRRMLGNIRLIGELYKKKMLIERIMHECIQKLLGQFQIPDEEDIEALCKLMSTIGEIIDHQKAKEHMDFYFERMASLSVNMNLSSRVRFMLKDSIDLRRNKWQQRRKVEGPKKIDEVHRDAAQERQVQASRLSRNSSNSNPSTRNRQMEFSPKPNQTGGRSTQQQRPYINQDFRSEERNLYENRTQTLPLPQRSFGDNSITLGPQGGLAKGMSNRGQSNSVMDYPNAGSSRSSGVETFSDRSSYEHPNMVDQNIKNENRADDSPVISVPIGLSEERMHVMSKSTIREYYSAQDMKEVSQCVKDLNAPSFYPTMISLWVIDSFERKDNERELLSKLLINLSTIQGGILNQNDLIKGFELVLSALEDAVNDAPRASEFLGSIFAKIILENMVSFDEIGQLVFEGGEEPGSLVESGLAADVIGTVMETIDYLKGESFLNEIRAGSSLKVEKFLHSGTNKSKLNAFILKGDI